MVEASTTTMNKLRWGILGTADIARQNWRAIYDSGNSIVTAVASRDAERSRQFIKKCQSQYAFEEMPKAYGNYQELIEASDIDAVYIPLPTGLRKEWVVKSARAGKHVLSEKPCGLCLNDVQEMIDTCRRNDVQFMDGVMFMHNPLQDGENIGQIKRISSMFSFFAADEYQHTNIRLHSELEPTGCLGDLGWYNIRFSLWAMGWRLPQAVSGRILSQRKSDTSPAPTPTDFSGDLIFDETTSAEFFCSFLTTFQQWAFISGTKGSMFLSDYVHPVNVHEPSFEINNTQIRVKCCDCTGEHSETREQAQDSKMFRNFANQIQSGQLNDVWPMMSLKTQHVLDACFESAKNGGRLTFLSKK
jgi:predicted dehydrogenase